MREGEYRPELILAQEEREKIVKGCSIVLTSFATHARAFSYSK